VIFAGAPSLVAITVPPVAAYPPVSVLCVPELAVLPKAPLAST